MAFLKLSGNGTLKCQQRYKEATCFCRQHMCICRCQPPCYVGMLEASPSRAWKRGQGGWLGGCLSFSPPQLHKTWFRCLPCGCVWGGRGSVGRSAKRAHIPCCRKMRKCSRAKQVTADVTMWMGTHHRIKDTTPQDQTLP